MYLQIQERLQALIESGSLVAGDRLPSIRSLAKTLQVNKLTVLEAYDRLVADGSICARQGSGYFVVEAQVPDPAQPCCFAPEQAVMVCETQANRPFAVYARSIQARQQPGWVDLSCAFPKHPPEDLARMIRRVAGDAEAFYAYDAIGGDERLRQQVAHLLLQVGLEASPEDILIVNGAMQGLSLAIRHFLKPGDWVVVESPTFFSVLPIFEQVGCRIIGIPMDREGMNLDLLARYLESHRPRLIFTISTLHNPTGITTPETHRRQLLDLAGHYQCPILEDNAYEGLHFGSPPPPLKVLDPDGWVTYVGTFSKVLSPGLRVGYLVAPPAHRQALLEQRYLTDIHTPTITQAVVSQYLSQGHYRRHLQKVHAQLRHNRNLVLHGLERHFPDWARWTVPDGGMYLWVQLPDPWGPLMPTLIQKAEADGILILSGAGFFPDGTGYPAIRISYANVLPERIDTALSRLGSWLKTLR